MTAALRARPDPSFHSLLNLSSPRSASRCLPSSRSDGQVQRCIYCISEAILLFAGSKFSAPSPYPPPKEARDVSGHFARPAVARVSASGAIKASNRKFYLRTHHLPRRLSNSTHHASGDLGRIRREVQRVARQLPDRVDDPSDNIYSSTDGHLDALLRPANEEVRGLACALNRQARRVLAELLKMAYQPRSVVGEAFDSAVADADDVVHGRAHELDDEACGIRFKILKLLLDPLVVASDGEDEVIDLSRVYRRPVKIISPTEPLCVKRLTRSERTLTESSQMTRRMAGMRSTMFQRQRTTLMVSRMTTPTPCHIGSCPIARPRSATRAPSYSEATYDVVGVEELELLTHPIADVFKVVGYETNRRGDELQNDDERRPKPRSGLGVPPRQSPAPPGRTSPQTRRG